MIKNFLLIMMSLVLSCIPMQAKERLLDGRLHHLRHGPQREWSDFPAQAEGPMLEPRFTAEVNSAEQTLRLRQQDVRQSWKVWRNGAGDGKRTSAYEYARRLVRAKGQQAIQELGSYDEAVAVQVASLLHGQGMAVQEQEIMAGARKVGRHVATGCQASFETWRRCQVARSQEP